MQRLFREEHNCWQIMVEGQRKYGRKVSIEDIKWIISRFIHYIALAISHGFPVKVTKAMTFSLYNIISSDIIRIKRESMYMETPALSGTYFGVSCEGKLMDDYRLEFKPAASFRKQIEKQLEDPDLAYKLIT